MIFQKKLRQNTSGVAISGHGHSERFSSGPNGSEVGGGIREGYLRLYDTYDTWNHLGQVKIFRKGPKLLPHSDFVPIFFLQKYVQIDMLFTIWTQAYFLQNVKNEWFFVRCAFAFDPQNRQIWNKNI